MKFFDDADLGSEPEKVKDAVRARRARHLADVYGVSASSVSQTGLPEPTSVPKPPVSWHNTLHISTARTWARLGRERRCALYKAVCGGGDPVGVFRERNGLGPVVNGEVDGHEDAVGDTVADFARDVQLEVCAESRGGIYTRRRWSGRLGRCCRVFWRR